MQLSTSAQTQADINSCRMDVQNATRRHFDDYYQNLTLCLEPTLASGDRKRQAMLKDSQELWSKYRDATVHATGEEWTTGSGRGAAEVSAGIQLIRARMRELEHTYDFALHL